MRLADAVRPVGADPEPHHVGDDQERRVLERERVLAELLEGRVQVGAPALVFPGEVVALPDVRPAVAARGLARAPPKNGMRPVHPGEILRDELEAIGLSANALSKALGVPVNRITAILNGQRGVTADTALACRP